MNKLKINIIGSIFGTTGYDSHTRNLFNALYKIADVKLSVPLKPEWQRFVNDAELDAITKPTRNEDINLIVTTPHNWKLCLGLGTNIGYCVWEGDKIPKSYIEEILNPKINLVFAPSEHTRKAIENTFGEKYNLIENKIKIIPHGVNRDIFYKTNKPKTNDKFIFLVVKGWRGTNWDRGGVQYVIKAFAEEFKKVENVQLEIKLNSAYINQQILQQAIENLNLPTDRPPIHVCIDNTPFDKLNNIYNDANVFICATRAESFNLPGIEAMACGLPTIQTNFGGQTDYMTKENSLFIDYELSESEEKPMYENINWATPKIESLKKQMRWAFENQDKIQEMGQQALEDSKNWTWDCSVQKIVDVINHI